MNFCKALRTSDRPPSRLANVRWWVYDRLEPLRKLYSPIERWIAYRTYDKYHVVKTGLKPRYYEKDEIILHVNFAILKDYVECECAWMHCISGEHPRPSWWARKFGGWRGPEMGLAHLDWEASLMCESGANAVQAKEAIEIRTLYLWWTVERPKRVDPFDFAETAKQGSDEYKQQCRRGYEIEEAQNQEDQDMLIRLMKIREALWT